RALLSYPTRRSSDLHSRLGGGGSLRLQDGAQIDVGDEFDVLDRGRDRPRAQQRGEVGVGLVGGAGVDEAEHGVQAVGEFVALRADRKSTRLNSSHVS